MIVVLLFSGIPAVEAASQTGKTNCKVILRKSANKDSSALQTLPAGETVQILSTTGDWLQVRYGEYKGYLMAKYVDINGSSAESSAASTSDQIKALGSAPGIMRPGDCNSDVKKLQQALKILGYYDGKIDGDYGSGTKKAVTNYQKAHGLTADGSAGEKTITSIFGSYSKTSLTTQTATTTNTVKSAKYSTVKSISEIGTAPKATKPGDSGSDVVKLQQALECLGYYSGTIDGSYGEGTTAAVKKLQKKRGMKADGIAGEATIRVLFGTTSSSKTSSKTSSTSTKTSYKTQVLDWFEDNVTKVIPKGATFTVKDVRSGRTFTCKRWSGANHMDVEPKTATDTATLKKIYGGSWSWNRRPILILYNGKVYAASMNGMPHGTSTISGNNFDGHFCIHFKNSKTHGTKKVDADHQSCVNEAAKATW